MCIAELSRVTTQLSTQVCGSEVGSRTPYFESHQHERQLPLEIRILPKEYIKLHVEMSTWVW
jgi:hypothetical protein